MEHGPGALAHLHPREHARSGTHPHLVHSRACPPCCGARTSLGSGSAACVASAAQVDHQKRLRCQDNSRMGTVIAVCGLWLPARQHARGVHASKDGNSMRAELVRARGLGAAPQRNPWPDGFGSRSGVEN